MFLFWRFCCQKAFQDTRKACAELLLIDANVIQMQAFALFRRVLETARLMGLTEHFYWLASDSWGAKLAPVEHQEWAAEGAVTILPQRTVLKGTLHC